jgi:hypothetical protein
LIPEAWLPNLGRRPGLFGAALLMMIAQAQAPGDPVSMIPVISMWGLGGYLAVYNSALFAIHILKTAPAERAQNIAAIDTAREAFLKTLAERDTQFLKAMNDMQIGKNRRHALTMKELRRDRIILSAIARKIGVDVDPGLIEDERKGPRGV